MSDPGAPPAPEIPATRVPAAEGPAPKARVVTLDKLTQLQAGDGPSRQFKEIPIRRLGREIFLWLLALVALELILLSMYAFWTFPGIGDVAQMTEAAADRNKNWTEARSAWVASLKDLGQIYLLTPVLPLIGAVIGYMFGRQQVGSE